MPTEEDKLFCKTAVERKIITQEQADEGLALVSKMSELGIEEVVSHMLTKKGYITPTQSHAVYKMMGLKKGEEIIPGYEIIAKLGEGGMGAVYKARKVGTKTMVALKVLPPRLAKNTKLVKRFVREATALATLNHENIVAGYEVGEIRGLNYFVMEFVDGNTLQELLDKYGKIMEKKAIEVTIQIARALDHSSSHGIIHRDIKPDNIMITQEGTAKLSDLGLSKSLDETRITAAGTIFGTPNYISPEQARGEMEVDIRSDIYSLGATLYHMLTGDVPFAGETPLVVLNKHITEDIPSPKFNNNALSEEICDIAKKMTARKREYRYQTPRELIQALEKLINKQPSKPEVPAHSIIMHISSNLTSSLRKRQVNPEHMRALREKLKMLDLGGVFIETQIPLEVDDVIEVNFTYPDGKKEAEAVGVVEWLGKEKDETGIGIRFLKIDTREKKRPSAKSDKNTPTCFDALIQNKLNQQILKIYFRELDSNLDINYITKKCGASKNLVEKTLSEFKFLELVEFDKEKNTVRFVIPQNQELWDLISNWVKKHGL